MAGRVKNLGGITKPPPHLSERGCEIWTAVVPRRARSPERRLLIQTALEALDRADHARAQIDADGLTFVTKKTGAVHVHPLLKVEKDGRALFARIWGQLGLSHYWNVDGVHGAGLMDP